MSRSLRVVHVATEMTPVAKVGGLADVVGGLSLVLSRRGHRVTVILPRYGFLEDAPWALVPLGDELRPGRDRRQEWSRLDVPEHPVEILVVGDPGFNDRAGIYVDPTTGEGYPGAAETYARFALGVTQFLAGRDSYPDILHVHDHQPALVPTLVKRGRGSFPSVKTVLTLHNLAFQGRYQPSQMAGTDLD